MAIDQRSEIFSLREQGVSIRQIAGQLGLSTGKVQRELAKRAGRPGGEAAQPSPAAAAVVVPVEFASDPGLLERQRRIADKRLALQESDLELRGLEQQQRLAMMQGAKAGDTSSQMMLLVLDRVEKMNERLSQQGAPRDTPDLIGRLGELKTLGNTIASFAPPTPPSSPAEVEFKVALARIQLEEQRLEKSRADEMVVRQQQAASENMRNEAIARFVESFGPILGSVAERWLTERSGVAQASPQLSATAGDPSAGDGAEPSPVDVGEIRGACPVCGVELAISEGARERCPGCGAQLLAEAGVIGQVVSQNGQRAATVTY